MAYKENQIFYCQHASPEHVLWNVVALLQGRHHTFALDFVGNIIANGVMR
jgi:hypothetical protein